MGAETQSIRAACDLVDALVAEKDQQLADANTAIQAQAANIMDLTARLAACEASKPQPQGPDYFIAPVARGTGTGLSESDASALAALPSLLARKPSAVVGLLPGSYSQLAPVPLAAGGTPDKPAVVKALGDLTIKGFWDSSKAPFIMPAEDQPSPVPTGAARSVTAPNWSYGWKDCFQLMAGANWITFQGLNLATFQRAWSLVGNVEGVTIEDSSGFCCQDHVYQKYGTGNGCKTLTIRRCRFQGYSKSAVRVNGVSSGVLIEDVLADSGWQISGEFAMGIFISDSASDVTVRRVTSRRNLDVQHWDDTNYWNGDGFVTERGVSNVLFEDCVAELGSDGGFDSKGTNVVFRRCKARNVKKSFRIWQSAVLEDCVSVTPHKFAIGTFKGGTSGSGDLEIIGGPDAAHPVVVTLKGSASLPGVIRSNGTGATAWYGQIVQG